MAFPPAGGWGGEGRQRSRPRCSLGAGELNGSAEPLQLGLSQAGNTVSVRAQGERSGADGSPEQGKVELDFIRFSLAGLMLLGCFLRGLVFVAWFLLAGKDNEWKVWILGWCWRRPAQQLVLVTSEAGCLSCAVF